jgi:hypothetical protein
LKYIEKQQEPSHPAADRGTLIHSKLEAFLRKEADFPEEAMSCEEECRKIASLPLTIEEEWGFKENWEPVSWDHPECMLKMKLDAFHVSPKHGLIIDWKSGKPSPIKHIGQGQLYTIGASHMFPGLESFTASFYYVDHGVVKSHTYKKPDIAKFQATFERRVERMCNDKIYKPVSNKWNCANCGMVCQYRSE